MSPVEQEDSLSSLEDRIQRAVQMVARLRQEKEAALEEAAGANAKEFFEPNLYLFDAYPGGIGFSEPLFRAHDLLVQKTRELIRACPCEAGCPSCVGPAGDLAPKAKQAALAILDRLMA